MTQHKLILVCSLSAQIGRLQMRPARDQKTHLRALRRDVLQTRLATPRLLEAIDDAIEIVSRWDNVPLGVEPECLKERTFHAMCRIESSLIDDLSPLGHTHA